MASETEPQLTAVGWHPVCLIVDYNAFWFLCLIFFKNIIILNLSDQIQFGVWFKMQSFPACHMV